MAEQLHTIPIADAMENAGECPFCYIERRVENHSMDYVLGHGASYMEADIRDMTDRQGFCRAHFKKMFDYGNSLGNAWILKTLMLRHMTEMTKEFKAFDPASSGKKGLFEIRIELGGDIFRVFCCFDEGSLVILFNGFQKKTQKTPSREIEKAERLMKEYFKSKESKE